MILVDLFELYALDRLIRLYMGRHPSLLNGGAIRTLLYGSHALGAWVCSGLLYVRVWAKLGCHLPSD